MDRTGVALRDDEVARRNSERTSELATAKANRDQSSQDRQRDLAKIGDLEQARQEIRAHHERSRGSKRWFFVARDGRVPFLEVTDSVMRQLGDGAVGIVESLGAVSDEHLVLASSDALERLSEFDPDAIRFWNRGGT